MQGRPAHQLLLAERAPVLGLHGMLGECMNPHLVTLWAQEAAVGTAEHLGNTYRWRWSQERGGGPTISVSRIECNTAPISRFRRRSQTGRHLNPLSPQPALETGSPLGLGQSLAQVATLTSLSGSCPNPTASPPSLHSGFCLPFGVSSPVSDTLINFPAFQLAFRQPFLPTPHWLPFLWNTSFLLCILWAKVLPVWLPQVPQHRLQEVLLVCP